MVEVHSDSSTHAIISTDREPEDAVKLNSSVVERGFNVVAGDDGARVAVREARREGGESWDSNSFVKAGRTSDVDVGVRVVGAKFTVSIGRI
jgi:hypothetical protein